ncbi:hypothetical protein KX816_01900 [Sphingosinicellaceae bacterium]|nr:hypothetical protein KX816_01900 [Sphingosinicellaceae bacterium]
MKFDIEGRIRNMRLPDGRTALLYSIYEAVMNGVQAIEERPAEGSDIAPGAILVNVSKNADKAIEDVVVHDNGIGLNDRHLDSFNVCDTMEKAEIGGRGVGRLVWLKAFKQIDVRSTYKSAVGSHSVSFRFQPQHEDSRENLTRSASDGAPQGTTISLVGAKEDDKKLSMALLSRSLSHHFFPFFIAGSMPQLVVRMGKREVNVGQYLSTRLDVENSEDVYVSDAVGVISITHVYVDPKIARELSNSILLTAQGRVVQSIEIEKKFALKGLENRKAYACVIRGAFLDEKVDQERTSFKAREEEIEAIKDAALASAQRFLSVHIHSIRTEQKHLVVSLLEEHPQLAISVDDVDRYVAGLSPSMSDEDIAKTLFTLLYRHEKKVRAQIRRMEHDEPEPKPGADTAVEALLQKVSDDAKLRLAEYTLKRHQIIQIARSMLRYSDPDRRSYELERSIHEFICPMGKMLTSKNYTEHNLWLIDELLSYYQFFASDKTLSSLGIEGASQEPDLLFLNPFGFRREGTNDPVVIIEFKRPGDERLSSDPIDQVLGYIEKLRGKTVRDADGQIIDEINDGTPFECIVICDLSEGAKNKLRRSVAQHPTPDGLGFYGFSTNRNASIRVISYKKLFRDAELRNKSFFDHLGLLPEEVNRSISAALSRKLTDIDEPAVR